MMSAKSCVSPSVEAVRASEVAIACAAAASFARSAGFVVRDRDARRSRSTVAVSASSSDASPANSLAIAAIRSTALFLS